ncbi:MAG: DUF3467 domain-containing protein [bacterium]|nr:DUF3467 domain-containing protein [bacterium]
MDPKEANPNLPPAAYANFMRVGQDRAEFFLTFGQVVQGQSQGPATGAHLLASFVTAPAHAKAMAKALADAVARYEANFGEIILPAAPQPASNGTAPPARARRA